MKYLTYPLRALVALVVLSLIPIHLTLGLFSILVIVVFGTVRDGIKIATEFYADRASPLLLNLWRYANGKPPVKFAWDEEEERWYIPTEVKKSEDEDKSEWLKEQINNVPDAQEAFRSLSRIPLSRIEHSSLIDAPCQEGREIKVSLSDMKAGLDYAECQCDEKRDSCDGTCPMVRNAVSRAREEIQSRLREVEND